MNNGADWRSHATRFASLLQRAVPLAESLEEAVAAADEAMTLDASFGLDAQGNWHGPQPPGPGWVEAGQGPQGGKVWRRSSTPAQQTPAQQPASPPARPGHSESAFGVARQAIESAVASAPDRKAVSAAIKAQASWLRDSFSRVAQAAVASQGLPPRVSRIVTSAAGRFARDVASSTRNDLTNMVAQLPRQAFLEELRGYSPDLETALGDFEADVEAELKDHAYNKALSRMNDAQLDDPAVIDRVDAEAGAWAQMEARKAATALRQAAGSSAALSVSPVPTTAPVSAFFAHDILNRKAQGVLNRAMKSVKEMSAAARRDLESLLKLPRPEQAQAVVDWSQRYRNQLSSILGSANLASLLEGARDVASRMPPVPLPGVGRPPPPSLPPDAAAGLLAKLEAMSEWERAKAIYELPADQQEYVNRALAIGGARPPLPPFAPPTPPAGSPEEVQFPVIEEAVRDLSQRNVVGRHEYDRLDQAARQKAFTIAGVEAQETLTKVRDALAANVAEGVGYEAFREKVLADVEPASFLSEGHLENIFRTNVQTALSDGQMTVLNHPFVRSGFPYTTYDAIHDDRVRDNHLALEKHGIQGTNIYRIDDPVFKTFRPPWDFNDRCGWTPMTIQQAAESGIAEAKQWLETGQEPQPPAFVPMPPFRPPPGFDRSLSAAPLSIRMSLDSMIDAAFGLDAQGNWHGPQPPGKGWVLVGEGPRGGKIWRPGSQPATKPDPAAKPAQTPRKQEPVTTTPKPAVRRTPSEVRKSLVESPITGAQQIGQSRAASLTYKLTLEDGSVGIWKPASGEYDTRNPGSPARASIKGNHWRREAAASFVAEIVGLADLVPATTVRQVKGGEGFGGVGSVQQFVPDAYEAAGFMPDKRFDGEADLARAAAFDFLVLNTDRHAGNWMLRKEGEGWKIALIDNGLSFPDTHDEPEYTNSMLLQEAVRRKAAIPEVVKSWAGQEARITKALQTAGLSEVEIGLTLKRLHYLSEAASRGETFDRLWEGSGIKLFEDMQPGPAATKPQENLDEAESLLRRAREADRPSRQAEGRRAVDKQMDELFG